MDDPGTFLLLATAGGTAILHTLIPDHWLPFVLIGRARGWTARTTAFVSGVSAVVHVGLSVLLGLLALAIGRAASETIGETLERAGAGLLIVFGVAYALWAWRKGGHFHPGGSWLHRHEAHAEACSGAEGGGGEHLHYHADDGMIRESRGWTGIGLALIVGANPCVLLLPIMIATAEHGAGAVGLVVAAYAVPTVLLMVALSAVGVAGARRIPVPGAARYMELASGLLIAVLGLGILVFGVH